MFTRHLSVPRLFLILRLALGFLFLYAGLTKVFDPGWSAAGFLLNAQSFPGFFAWLASPANIGWVNMLNEWGLTLLGLSLVVGLWVRFVAPLGALLMLLYYVAGLNFPYPNAHSFLVDEHIVYGLALLLMGAYEKETRAAAGWFSSCLCLFRSKN